MDSFQVVLDFGQCGHRQFGPACEKEDSPVAVGRRASSRPSIIGPHRKRDMHISDGHQGRFGSAT